MKPENFEEEIQELVEAGVFERVKDRNSNQRYRFTEDGKALTELQIAMDTDMQLFLFQIMWQQSDIADEHRRLVSIGMKMKEDPDVNIFRTLESNMDKIHGLKLNDDHLPEEFVKQFDPEVKGNTSGDTDE